MPLGTLTCGGNRLKGIDFFIKRPPDDFLFDCDTISTGELEWIHTTWARDFRFARHARNVEVLLALRRNDVARLRALAAEFRGHRYLFVPKPLQWEEARAFCEKLGGHLVTIGSREENEFVQSLFPHGGWVWMGLYTGPDGHHWVTGEPFTFSYYNDLLRENKLGPKVFTGKWASDDVPFAHNTFVIEWDE